MIILFTVDDKKKTTKTLMNGFEMEHRTSFLNTLKFKDLIYYIESKSK